MFILYGRKWSVTVLMDLDSNTLFAFTFTFTFTFKFTYHYAQGCRGVPGHHDAVVQYHDCLLLQLTYLPEWPVLHSRTFSTAARSPQQDVRNALSFQAAVSFGECTQKRTGQPSHRARSTPRDDVGRCGSNDT